ncbi:lysozyme inhibitor LprI family protein [Pseudomonas sp. NPDC089752]|uniref:lysozyme inhibitor LprI family protein n=1 Tax=Pseudomonas sp. NPDC089752 TaxID=3364472 RepID=UPI0037FA4649
MKTAIKAGIAGAVLVVVGPARAELHGEEAEIAARDAAVRQYAAKLEADWQQCLRKPETKTTQDSGLCAYAMREAAKDAVKEKYQKALASAKGYADEGSLPKDVPDMMPQAQAAWEKFVEADCGVVGALTTGTASATYQILCEYKHQIQRLHDLDEW